MPENTPTINNPVSFKIGSDTAYQDLIDNNNIDENAVYFISDTNGNSRIYVGSTCYNIGIVENLETGTIGQKVVPSTQAVVTQLNKKVTSCTLINRTDTELPATLLLDNNTEYRFFNLEGASEITVTFPSTATQPGKFYYSSIVLYELSGAGIVSEFVKVPTGGTPVSFLNGDLSLLNTAELLFFSNGRDICCIAGTYDYEPET